jgi:hypothetical protein
MEIDDSGSSFTSLSEEDTPMTDTGDENDSIYNSPRAPPEDWSIKWVKLMNAALAVDDQEIYRSFPFCSISNLEVPA